MDPDLDSVLKQLDVLRTTVTALAKTKTGNAPAAPLQVAATSSSAAPLRVASSSSSQDEASSRLSRTRSLADVASDEDASNLRPTLYPHPPRPQNDSLEESHWDGLDALKLDSFQGFFNLSMLLLACMW